MDLREIQVTYLDLIWDFILNKQQPEAISSKSSKGELYYL